MTINLTGRRHIKITANPPLKKDAKIPIPDWRFAKVGHCILSSDCKTFQIAAIVCPRGTGEWIFEVREYAAPPEEFPEWAPLRGGPERYAEIIHEPSTRAIAIAEQIRHWILEKSQEHGMDTPCVNDDGLRSFKIIDGQIDLVAIAECIIANGDPVFAWVEDVETAERKALEARKRPRHP